MVGHGQWNKGKSCSGGVFIIFQMAGLHNRQILPERIIFVDV